MKTIHQQIITLAASAVIGTVALTGCSSTAGYKQADKTGAGIADFRVEITKAKAAVDDTVKALGQVAVTAHTDPRSAFEKFTKSLANLESTSAKAKQRGEDMKAKGKAYFSTWEKELEQIKNPEIRALATEQKVKLQSAFESIRTVSAPLKEQFDPWMSDLQDLQKYLSSDLTVSGVDAAKGLFAKTQTEGFEVQKSMDALVAELNTVAATLTPANVKAK
jgi:hypothetical protein